MIWTLQLYELYWWILLPSCFLIIDRPQKVSPTSRHPTVTKYRQHGGDSNGLCHRRMCRRIVGARSLVLILRRLSCQQRVLMYMLLLLFGASPGDFVGCRVNDRLRSGWFSTLRSPLICNFGRLLRFSTSNGYQCRYVSGVFSRVSASVWWCCAGVVVVTLLSLGVLLVHCFNLQRWFRRIVVYMNFLDSSPNCDMLDSASSWFAGISGIIMGIICVCATADSYETIGRKSYNFSLSS